MAVEAVGTLRALAALAAICAGTSFGASFRDGCAALEGNPARGAAPGGWHLLKKTGNVAGSPTGFCSWLWNIGAFSHGNQYETNAIPTCVGGEDLPLSDDALLAVSNTLVNARANGAVMIIRFGYTSGSEVGTEPADFNVLVRHIRQLGSILAEFPDVVLAVEGGMCGPWGEMHSTNYREPEHIKAMGDAWLETLAPSTALLVRYPMWILQYANKQVGEFLQDVADGSYIADQPAQARIGMFNDGYLGSATDYGTWRSDNWWMTRQQGVAYLDARRNVPYGGELAHLTTSEADAVERDLLDPAKYNIVQEFYRTHLCYLRNIDTKGHRLAGRLETHLLTHDYDFDGMPDLSEWYGRNLRDFMRAHTGYRFVVRDAKFGSYPGFAYIGLTIENTGFGQPLSDDNVEVVFSGERGVFAVRPRGGISLCDIGGGERRAMQIELDYPKSMPAGDYDVLLRVSSARHPIQFANEDCWNETLKANRLCGVVLGESSLRPKGSMWFAWNPGYGSELGGRWDADTYVGEYLSRNFVINSGVPKGKTGEVSIEIVADAMGEIPCPAGGKASFIFLDDGHGNPVPYGYCAEGWVPLLGCSVADGETVVLKMRLSGKGVSYVMDDVQLVDKDGREWLPVSEDISTAGELSLVGAADDYGFFGTIQGNDRTLMVLVK